MNWNDCIARALKIVERCRRESPTGFDVKNIGVALGVTAAAVVAAGATAYSASSASSSAATTNATNAADISDTNQLNYNEFQQSRGSQGSAIYPIYASNAEQQLYQETLGTYNATGTLAPTGADYSAIASAAEPGANGATTAANGIFNGQTLNTELANQQPVSAANLALANTTKQSSLESLQQTLNNIKSIQAGKGYAGDSFGNQLLNFNARQQANTAGAQAVAGATLQNAEANQGIQENSINRELQNLNAPTTAATQQTNLAQLPSNALSGEQVNRQNLFSNFKIGTQAFQYTPTPLVSPTSSTGQIAGQAVGSLASTAGGVLTANSLANTAATNAATASNFGLSASDIASGVTAANSVPAGQTISALSGDEFAE